MSPDAPQGPRYPVYPGEQPPAAPAPASHTPTPPYGTGGAAVPAHEATASSWEPAGWWIRVLASIVDGLIPLAIALVPFVGGLVIAFSDATYDEATDIISGADPWGFVVAGLGWVAFVAFDLWNRGLRVGYRGQSLGKQLVGVHVVGRSGGPVGPLEGFFRWLLAQLLQWTFVGLLVDLLWPLWDDRKQTVHDKAIGTFPVRR